MNKIAFQGERGAFSELAAVKYFGRKIQLSPSLTFASVFEKVKKSEVDYGIVPIENSLYGSVIENYDLLFEHSLYIVGEINLQITHCLMGGKKQTISDIRKIYSHPQALGQCSRFIKSLKKVKIAPFYDTAGAAKAIAESGEKGAAAIASEIAAREYGLKVFKKAIQNNSINFTRFIIISKKAVFPKEKEAKTSICFELKSIPGALFRALSVFALRDLNLSKIESRPIPGKTFQYFFYIDIIGNLNDERLRKALAHLSEISHSIKVFGSYKSGFKRPVKNR